MAFKNPKRYAAKKQAELARKKMMARLFECEAQDLSDQIDAKTAIFVDSSRKNLASKEQMQSIIALLEKWEDAESNRTDILRSLS